MATLFAHGLDDPCEQSIEFRSDDDRAIAALCDGGPLLCDPLDAWVWAIGDPMSIEFL